MAKLKNLVGLKSQEVREVDKYITKRENSCVSREHVPSTVYLISLVECSWSGTCAAVSKERWCFSQALQQKEIIIRHVAKNQTSLRYHFH